MCGEKFADLRSRPSCCQMLSITLMICRVSMSWRRSGNKAKKEMKGVVLISRLHVLIEGIHCTCIYVSGSSKIETLCTVLMFG